VVNWLAGHLGQEFDYRGIAADTDIGSKDTAQSYLDLLVASYVALVVYRTPSLTQPAAAFRSPKKIHPADPLWWHLIQGWAASDPDPWPAALTTVATPDQAGHLVESVLAVHLRRAFGDRVYYWRRDERREIDFVLAPSNGPVTLIEAKYQNRVDERDLRPLLEAGGGLVATRQRDGSLSGGLAYALPVATLLASIETPGLSAAR
jgi:predicted AAA+ superfamily ATPase